MKQILLVVFALVLMAGCAKYIAEKKPPKKPKVEAKKVKKSAETPVPKGIIPDRVMKAATKRYGYFARKRYEAYNAKLYELQDRSTEAKLKGINDFFNKVPYGEDIDVWGEEDYWATPLEFLGRDRGDCEDYVIAKYFALRDLGIPSEKLFISYVVSSRLNDEHMVLSYFPTPSSVPLVLDNTNYRIFPADQRKDLTPVYNLNIGSLNLAGGQGQNLRQVKGNGQTINRWERVIEDVERHKY